MLAGLAALFGSGMVAAVLRLVGVEPITGIIVLVVIALPMTVVGMSAGHATWRAILGLLLATGTPFVAFIAFDAQPFGGMATGTVNQAAAARSATAYRFDDATLRTDLMHRTAIATRGRRGANRTDFVVAPVVGAGWTPADPVTAWAVHRTSVVPPAWSAGGGIVGLFPDPMHDEVVARAARRHGLRSAPSPIIGLWVPDPAAAQRESLWLFAAILGSAMLLWSVLVMTGRRMPTLDGHPRML